MRKIFCLSFFLFAVAIRLLSQSVPLKGMVTDEKGVPLSGVSVTARGTRLGTTTNEEGRFTLSVPSNVSVLIFSSINYAMEEMAIGSKTNFTVTLKAAAKDLTEV